MSFAPRFLLLFTLVIFPWGCGQDTDSPPDDTSQTALDFADENLAGELDDAQAQKLLRHLERGEVQEATALLAQLNLDNPKILIDGHLFFDKNLTLMPFKKIKNLKLFLCIIIVDSMIKFYVSIH